MPKKAKTNDEALKILNSLGLDYDFSGFKYDGCRNNLSVVRCPKHGEFLTSFHTIMKSKKGLVCKKCRNEYQSLVLMKQTYGDDFNYRQYLIKRIDEKLPDHRIELDKISDDIIYTKFSKIELWCKKHGRFLIKIDGLIKHGIGCPWCKKERGERTKVFIDIKTLRMAARQHQGMCLSQTYKGLDARHWFCCEYGNVFQTTMRMIRDKNVWCSCKSCRPTRRSNAEDLIADYLSKRRIRFETEKRFPDLRSDCGQPLSFDFYLPDYGIVIEYDGKQHFVGIEYFGGDDVQRRITVNDDVKNEYIKKSGMNIIRIAYKQQQNIVDILNSYLFETQEYWFVGFK